MSISERYLGRAVGLGYLAVLAILVGLFAVADLVKELDDVGKGRYGFLEALVVVGLMMPGRVVELSAVSGLIGTILALGALGGAHELVVLRASGVSPQRIARATLLVSVPLVILVAVLIELVVPLCEQAAHTRRSIAVTDAPAAQTERGFWYRDGDRVVRVGSIRHGNVPVDVIVFVFSRSGALLEVLRAESASVVSESSWILHEVDRTPVSAAGVPREHLARLPFPTTLGAAAVGLVRRRPESLGPSDLLHQIRTRREHALDAETYEVVLWQKLGTPLLTAAMMMLGVPFVLGRARSIRFGRRLALGALVGIGAYVLVQALGYLCVILQLEPAIVGFAPVFGIAGLALALIGLTA